VNHYFTKSLEEWRERRAYGKADKTSSEQDFVRGEAEFHRHDVNDVVDLRAAAIMQAARSAALRVEPATGAG
jgi:hypothetical protein